MQSITNYFVVNLDRDNRIYVFLVAFFAGVLGSVVSFMLAIAFIGALLFIGLKLFPWKIESYQKPALYAISAYPIVMILAVLLHYQSGDSLSWIVRVLPFFAGWLILARTRQSPDGTLISCLIFGAGIGMIGTFLICVVQVLLDGDRVAGGAGNAAVLGLFAVLFSTISLMNLHSPSKLERRVAVLGFVTGLCCLLLSETRTAWLVFPVNLLIVVLYLQNKIVINYKKIIIPIVAVVLVAGFVFYPKVAMRVEALQTDIAALDNNPEAMTSLNIRLMIWQGAIKAIGESPVFGYGAQHRIAAFEAQMPKEVANALTVTHVHNAFLNVAIDAGLIGVLALILAIAAPIIAACSKQAGPERDAAMAIALMLVASYLITGMLGIMFGHDATDAIYISLFLTVCHGAGNAKLVPFLSGFGKDK